MFLQFYGLKQQPFGVTPDPSYLYPSQAHREALASLVYGFESQLGFATLIAGPGLGKTTLLHCLLERFGPVTRSAFIFETQCDSRELLRHILCDLDADTAETDMNAMFRAFRDLVVKAARSGRRVLLLIDEAQNLAAPALETVRLLSNFETSTAKLLHIVLAGQVQLADMLARPDLGQLRQRITTAARLRPFTFDEVSTYIEHRLRVAGYRDRALFTPEAVALIAQLSSGVPREINRICFNAMSLGFALQLTALDASLVREAAADLDLGPLLAATPEVLSPAPAPQTKPAEAAAPWKTLPFPPAREPVAASPPVRLNPAPVALPALRPLPVARAVAPPLSPVAEARPAPEPLPLPVLRPRRFANRKFGLVAGATLLVAAAVALAFAGRLLPALTSRVSATSVARADAPSPATSKSATVAGPDTTPAAPVVENDASPPPQHAPATATRESAATEPRSKTSAPAHEDARPATPAPPLHANADTAAAPPPLSAAANPAPLPALVPIPVPAAPTSAAPSPPVFTGFSPGRLLRRVDPQYPANARAAHIQGSVVLNAHVARDGRITSVRAVQGNPVLAEAAADAIRRWVYTPFVLNGQAVEADTTIIIKFSL